MRKEYVEPIVEIFLFDASDVLTASSEFELEDDNFFNNK